MKADRQFQLQVDTTMKENKKDTICPTHVVAIARRERMEPTRLSFRSVTDAMPTPTSNTRRESFMLWLHAVILYYDILFNYLATFYI